MNSTMVNTFRASFSLSRRELVRFYRQKSRIIGVIGSPLIFWFVIGSGLTNSFVHPGNQSGMSYLEYFFPGTIALIILFTSIFSTISIIEDRQAGFLQSVIVSPIPRYGIVLGKILGGTILSLVQAILLLIVTPFIGIQLTIVSFLLVCLVLFILSFGLTGLGFLIAWKMDSSQGFHAIMNLFLIPLWLLSGALFPASGAAGWLGHVMDFNPLSYGMTALRGALYYSDSAHIGESSSFIASLTVTIVFSAATFIFSTILVNRSENASK
jgi:ABC-2 type transport system permease protein